MGTVDLDPYTLCTSLDEMGWYELDDVYHAVLGAFAVTAEAPGAQRRESGMPTSHGKPGSAAPRASPLCDCRCPSQADHWRRILDAAGERDMSRDQEPRSFRDALFRAAEDLHNTRHPIRHVDRNGKPEADASGIEREMLICHRYVGMPSAYAAVFESRRAGPISPEALRRCRRKHEYGMEFGFPRLPDDQLEAAILAQATAGVEPPSDREIARRLDVGRTKVANILAARTARGTTERVAA